MQIMYIWQLIWQIVDDHLETVLQHSQKVSKCQNTTISGESTFGE